MPYFTISPYPSHQADMQSFAKFETETDQIRSSGRGSIRF